jgi:glycosyltransferase involved in cell wall biosynthesis
MKIVCTMWCYDDTTSYEPIITPKYLARLGHEVIIVAANLDIHFKRLPTGKYVTNGGLELHRLKTLFTYGHDFAVVKGYRRLLNQIKPDLVFCHCAREPLAYISARLKKKLGYVLLVDHHDFFYPGHSMRPLRKSIRNLIAQLDYLTVRKWLGSYVFKRADKVLAVTGVCREHLRDFFKLPDEKTVALEFAVDTEIFHYKREDIERMKAEWGLVPGQRAAIYTGLITRRKKFEKIVDLLGAIDGYGLGEKLKILVAGRFMEKDYEEEIICKIASWGMADRVIFLGEKNKDELAAIYSAADMAFWIENNSIAILEAMASGCIPIVPRMQLAHLVGEYGIVFEPGNIAQLAEAMGKASNLGDSDAISRRMVMIKHVESKYSYAEYAKTILSFANH